MSKKRWGTKGQRGGWGDSVGTEEHGLRGREWGSASGSSSLISMIEAPSFLTFQAPEGHPDNSGSESMKAWVFLYFTQFLLCVVSVGEPGGRVSCCQEVIYHWWGMMIRKWCMWSFPCHLWDFLLISFSHLSQLWKSFFLSDEWQMAGFLQPLPRDSRLGVHVMGVQSLSVAW